MFPQFSVEPATLSVGPFARDIITLGQVVFLEPGGGISDILWTRVNPFDASIYDLVLLSDSSNNPEFPVLAFLLETGDWQSVGEYFFRDPANQVQVYVVSDVIAPVPLPAALPLFSSLAA